MNYGESGIDSVGDEIFISAIENKCSENVIDFLYGIDGSVINRKDRNGNTAMHYASKYNPDLIDYIFGKCDYINEENKHGSTPLDYAADSKTAAKLLKMGAEWDKYDVHWLPKAMKVEANTDCEIFKETTFYDKCEGERSKYFTPEHRNYDDDED